MNCCTCAPLPASPPGCTFCRAGALLRGALWECTPSPVVGAFSGEGALWECTFSCGRYVCTACCSGKECTFRDASCCAPFTAGLESCASACCTSNCTLWCTPSSAPCKDCTCCTRSSSWGCTPAECTPASGGTSP